MALCFLYRIICRLLETIALTSTACNTETLAEGPYRHVVFAVIAELPPEIAKETYIVAIGMPLGNIVKR